mmetsp:Transcript_9423/g.31228  ORF Transcript_9423/g.31228 Transcript_9423/m.31228 type:complete len:203 (-) Transcript_9423:711-1319(-)
MCMCTPSTTSTKTRGVHSSRVEHPQPAPDVLGWERVRLSERLHRGAGRVEPRDVGRVEPPRERAQVILELPQVARARDGSRPLGDTPVDGHLGGGGAVLLRRLRDCVDQAGGGLGLAAEEGLGQLRARSLGQLFGRVLAAQQSEADGRVGEHLDAELVALALQPVRVCKGVEQRVLDLVRVEGDASPPERRRDRLDCVGAIV